MEILEKAQQLKAELDSLRPLENEVEARIWQKFRLDWNYHSNKLEGNTYSYGETKMLLLKGLTAGGKPVRDHQEISGHDEAISFIIESIREKEELTEIFIRHLHKMILVRPFWADAKTPDGQPTKRLIKVGEYKIEPNHVETQTGAIFYFAEPIETPAKMQELVEWFRVKSESPETNAILLAAEFHYRFVRIHPFDDGNGRMARLLMNFILMKSGYPPVIIKTEDKDNYIAVLEQAEFNILEPFIEYIATNLVHSLEIMIRGAKGQDIEEPEDLDKELALLERKVRGTGKKIEITKNKDVLVDIYDKSIAPLANAFIESERKFDRFYMDQKFIIMLNENQVPGEFDNAVHYTREKLEQSVSILKMFYIHNAFNQYEIGSFDFVSSIIIKFDLTTYSVAASDASVHGRTEDLVLYERLYTEQLRAEEVVEMIKKKAKQHKEFINQKYENWELRT